MIDIEILIYSSLSSSMIIVSSLVLYLNIRKYKAQHLNLVALGLFLQAMLPLSFVPQAFLADTSQDVLISSLAIFGADMLLIGFLLTIWNLKIHQNAEIPRRFILMVLLTGFSLGWVIIGTHATFDGSWEIVRSSEIKLVMFGPVGWMLAEMFRVFYKGYKASRSTWGKLIIAYPLSLFVSFVLLALREQLPFSNAFYQLWTGFGAIFLAVALVRYPDALVLPNIKVSAVILMEKESGVAIARFPDEDDDRTQLTSAALSGTLEIIREISGKDHLPPKLGYVDYTIGVYPHGLNSSFCISTGEHPLLTGLMILLSQRWNVRVRESDGSINNKYVREFQDDVRESLGIFI